MVITHELPEAPCTRCNLTAKWNQIEFNGVRLDPMCWCEHCERDLSRQWSNKETARAREQRTIAEGLRAKGWDAECPIGFRECDRDRIPSEPMRQMLDSYEIGQGVGLVGNSRMGKTRVAYMCLKRAHNQRCGVRAINHVSFACLAKQAARSEPGAEYDLARLGTVHTLLLDDLGKGADSPRALEALWNTVEVRTSNNRPIIWTANGTGEYLQSKLGGEYGEPIIERLREFTEIIAA